jgi:hypothetical protein
MPKCDHCNKDFATQGALNLHKYHLRAKQKQRPEPQDCTHTWRLLNPRVPNEYNAMTHGHEEVCTKCQDLQ